MVVLARMGNDPPSPSGQATAVTSPQLCRGTDMCLFGDHAPSQSREAGRRVRKAVLTPVVLRQPRAALLFSADTT